MILESALVLTACEPRPVIAKANVIQAPVDEEQAQLARRALSEYGKGRHPAGLNFGTAFRTPLAKALDPTVTFQR